MTQRRLRRASALLLAVLMLAMTACSAVDGPSTAGPTAASGLTRYRATFLELFDTVTVVMGYASDSLQIMVTSSSRSSRSMTSTPFWSKDQETQPVAPRLPPNLSK